MTKSGRKANFNRTFTNNSFVRKMSCDNFVEQQSEL